MIPRGYGTILAKRSYKGSRKSFAEGPKDERRVAVTLDLILDISVAEGGGVDDFVLVENAEGHSGYTRNGTNVPNYRAKSRKFIDNKHPSQIFARIGSMTWIWYECKLPADGKESVRRRNPPTNATSFFRLCDKAPQFILRHSRKNSISPASRSDSVPRFRWEAAARR